MAVAKTVAKIPAKIASPSKVVNQTVKTVNDDAGTMKLAPKPVSYGSNLSTPKLASAAPKAPVKTPVVNNPSGAKDLTTLIANLNNPNLQQPIYSNTPIPAQPIHNAQSAAQANAELAKAQAAHRALMDSIAAKEAAAAQAKAAQAAAAANPTVPAQPIVQPAPAPAPAPKPNYNGSALTKPAPAPVQQPAPTPINTAPVLTPPPQTVVQPAPTPVQQPVAGPVAPTPAPTPDQSYMGPPAGSSNVQWKQNPTTGAWESYNPQQPAPGPLITGSLPPPTPTPTPAPTPAPTTPNYKLPTGWSFTLPAAPKA